jgi:hypothetical protein
MKRHFSFKSFFSLVLLAFFISISVPAYTQSITVNSDGKYTVELNDEEKAVKASSSFIKPKQDLRWETHIKSIKIMWEIKYIKDSKLYILIKDHQKFYSSTTIEGIRNSFKAELLGTAAINTANNNLTNNQNQ